MLALGSEQLFQRLQKIKGSYPFVTQIILVVTVAIFLLFFLQTVHAHLLKMAKKSSQLIRQALIQAAFFPTQIVVLLLAFIMIVDIVHYEVIPVPGFDYIMACFPIVVVILIASFLLLFGKGLERLVLDRGSPKAYLDRTTVKGIAKCYQLLVLALCGITLLQIFGIPLSGVIAFGGVGGIAIGFAAKDLLANFFGGIMIFLDRPFAIGDMIRSPDRAIEGVVEHIGFRQVMIKNIEQRPLYIPNSLFSTLIIENISRMKNRRIKLSLPVEYQDYKKLTPIKEAVENLLKTHPEVDVSKNILVALIGSEGYHLSMMVEVFTKTTNKVLFYQVQHAIIVQILSIFESFGLRTPSSTQSVFLENPSSVLSYVEKKLQ